MPPARYRAVATAEDSAAHAAPYRAGGMGYGEAKQALFEVLDRTLDEPRRRYEAWMADPAGLDAVLADGARRARDAAGATMARVRSRVGLT
jgi:tryptophanyl-tRNA synthetase